MYSAKPIKSEQKKDSEIDECEEDVDDFGVNSADNKYQMIEATFTIVEEVSSYLGNFAEIPGVSLILNGIRTIIDIVRARRANKARIRMNDNRRLFKEKYLNKGTDDKAMVKEMGKYKSLLKFWKRTNITVDIKTMEKRLDELNASGDDSEPVKEEKEDIMKFLTQERIRDVSKSKRISSMLSFMGDLPKTILSLSTLVGFPFASIISTSAGIISTAGGHKDDYTRKKTKAKASKYTQYLIEIIGNLPDTIDAQEDKIKYVEANDMVESTGLDTLKLKNTIAEGKMQTFNMFVELLGG